MYKKSVLYVIPLLHFAVSSPIYAVTTATLNTFTVNNEGWEIGGSGIQPAWVDAMSFNSIPGYLQHVSSGSGSNGKWLMWNSSADWQGDYLAAGITTIHLWVDNAAGNPLGLRVAFNGPGGWFYSSSQTVINSTASADWIKLSYDLNAAHFTHSTASSGTGVFADTLSNVSRFEIFGGSSTVTYKSGGDLLEAGTSINTLRIDQIQAVPETSVFGSLALAACLLTAYRKNKII